jgi:hypothetical protein
MTVLFQGFEQQPYWDVIKLYVRQSLKIIYLDHQLQQTAVCSTRRVDRTEVVEDIVSSVEYKIRVVITIFRSLHGNQISMIPEGTFANLKSISHM